MEQAFSPAQYFGMIVAATATIMYFCGLYLIMTDKEKKGGSNDPR